MDASKVTMALLGVSLLLGPVLDASAAEDAQTVYKATELAATKQQFRNEIESYLRSHDERLRTTLGEDLRVGFKPRVVLAMDENRARG
jgi:hypothetical protein